MKTERWPTFTPLPSSPLRDTAAFLAAICRLFDATREHTIARLCAMCTIFDRFAQATSTPVRLRVFRKAECHAAMCAAWRLFLQGVEHLCPALLDRQWARHVGRTILL